MNKSKVFINEFGVIEFVVVGDMTADSVNLLADKAELMTKKLRAEGKPVLMLDNLYELGKAAPDVRITVVERIKSIGFDKFAVASDDRLIRFGANLILHATGKGDAVKFFVEYDKAIAWLTA